MARQQGYATSLKNALLCIPHPAQRSRRSMMIAGWAFLFLGTAVVLLLGLSVSQPWLVGQQHEPHWSWAIGSGRIKVWVAQPGAFGANDNWTSSWYRGLDGQPIRWDFTISGGSTGGVLVVAVPLWAISAMLWTASACAWTDLLKKQSGTASHERP